jgi:hypothetical protein
MCISEYILALWRRDLQVFVHQRERERGERMVIRWKMRKAVHVKINRKRIALFF